MARVYILENNFYAWNDDDVVVVVVDDDDDDVNYDVYDVYDD